MTWKANEQERTNKREKVIILHSPTTPMLSSPPPCHNSDVSSTPFEMLQQTNPRLPINQQTIVPSDTAYADDSLPTTEADIVKPNKESTCI